MPAVSIIIAAYRAEKHIESSVRSALDQTFSDLEVVVVDDGSDDATAAIVRSIDDSRVKLIQQANRGQSAALNTGVANSTGSYIKFLDADDQLNDTHIASQMEAIANETDKLASCRWCYFVEAPPAAMPPLEHTSRNIDDPVQWIVESLTLDDGMMGGWMWLIPRDVLNRAGGWDERLSLNNDFDFSIRLLLSSSGVRFASNAVYYYRKGLDAAVTSLRSNAAMTSAFLTTELGCNALLARENSERTREVCADRWQQWAYLLYPGSPDLANRAIRNSEDLGGSDEQMRGGKLLHVLLPIVGWKAVRRLQTFAYSSGWRAILGWKEQRRIAQIRDANAEVRNRERVS